MCSFWVKEDCKGGEERSVHIDLSSLQIQRPTSQVSHAIQDQYGINDSIAYTFLKWAVTRLYLDPSVDKIITILHIGGWVIPSLGQI